ncbi:MAG: hypothetical protein C5B50_11435 [Verrucomicrobia bacterium]|nr:MAG: hypothetical protein C5B50_11435 [Verrucomicrobiota bacterium]
MGLDNPKTVDAAGIEKETEFAVLTIADSWDWEDERQHLEALQTKLNAYFNFIESGQIRHSYPEAAGRKVVIEIVGKYPLSLCRRPGLILSRAPRTSAWDWGLK